MIQHQFNRFHQAAAACLTIAGVNINVLAVQAFRTMVRIAVARNFIAAVLADKIFNFALEFFDHKNILNSAGFALVFGRNFASVFPQTVFGGAP